MLLGVIGFVITLGVIVTVHEYGHYLAARLCGIPVIAFSVGFGKTLISRVDARGCEWRLGALPLGGFVNMLNGERKELLGDEADRFGPDAWARSFDRQSVWRRFFTVAAGPAMNLILAVLIYAALALVGGQQLSTRLAEPPEGSPAAQAGLREGDLITAVNGEETPGLPRLRLLISLSAERPVIRLTALSPGGARRDYELFPPPATTEDQLEALGLLPWRGPIEIVSVEPDGPAAAAGLRPGDRVLSVDGAPVSEPGELTAAIRAGAGRELTLELAADDGRRMARLTPWAVAGPEGTVGRIGVRLTSGYDVVWTRYGPLAALGQGFSQTWDTIRVTVAGFVGVLRGTVSASELSGPLAIGDLAGQTLRFGLSPFLLFLALVSVSIGILNLLPVPMLDGGHLLYYSWEIVSGRRPSPKVVRYSQALGASLLILLTVFALGNDLSRLWPSWVLAQ